MPTTAIVIQARTGSTRLPGKVLKPVAGAPMLQRMVERVMLARLADRVIVATTTDPGDAPIAELCAANEFACHRGHPTDLLDRHYRAGLAAGADVVVKIPSDCPLIDPAIIDRVLAFYGEHAAEYDFVSNLHPQSYPDGNDVEVMPMAMLELAWREADEPFQREHTTPFFWDQPDRFRVGNVTWETGRDASKTHRWTVDYPEDYALVKAVYGALWPVKGAGFSIDDILELLAARPELHQINARYAGVNWYRHHLDQLQTVGEDDTRAPDQAREPTTSERRS